MWQTNICSKIISMLFSKLISYVVLNSHQCFFHPYLLPSLFKNFKNGNWILCGRQISVRKSYQCFFHPYLLPNILRILKMVIEFLFKYFKNGGQSHQCFFQAYLSIKFQNLINVFLCLIDFLETGSCLVSTLQFWEIKYFCLWPQRD